MQRSALCRSRRELSNAYLLAKFGFDAAENEPLESWTEIRKFGGAKIPIVISKFPWKLEIWTVGPVCLSEPPRWLPSFALRSVAASSPANGDLSCRYRTFLWFFSQMSKLYRPRSPLYRRQILQENIRWRALDEIFKIYMLLHRSDFNISEKFRHFFSHFLANTR